MTLAPGAQVGRYRIVAALGAGGMGEVCRAEDTSLGRQVAIKMLPDAFAGDPERLARCLEKDPGLRVQTARDVWSDLKAIKEATESGARSTAERAGTPASARQRRVAVLPFVNMSADPEQQYFCDGMAEEIINALAHVEGLEVAARTSAFAFKGQDRDIRAIGRLLDVGSALEGSVRRAGDRAARRPREGLHRAGSPAAAPQGAPVRAGGAAE